MGATRCLLENRVHGKRVRPRAQDGGPWVPDSAQLPPPSTGVTVKPASDVTVQSHCSDHSPSQVIEDQLRATEANGTDLYLVPHAERGG